MSLITERLLRLPGLAKATNPPKVHVRSTDGGGHATPGPCLPAGVDNVIEDMSVGCEQPHLLARISSCVRVVLEEVPDAWGALPDPGPERSETWESECRWLRNAEPLWRHDAWCVEWIDTETQAVETELLALMAARTGRCWLCDAEVEVGRSETTETVSCPRCDRVMAMRVIATPEDVERRRQAAILDGARRLLGLTGSA